MQELTGALDAASRGNALELDEARVALRRFEFDVEACAAAHASLHQFWRSLEQINSECRKRDGTKTPFSAAALLFPLESPADNG